jgi:hypothetical protein
VAAALEFWGLERAGASGFLDPDLVRPDAEWTAQVESAEALELWRALAEIASRR